MSGSNGLTVDATRSDEAQLVRNPPIVRFVSDREHSDSRYIVQAIGAKPDFQVSTLPVRCRRSRPFHRHRHWQLAIRQSGEGQKSGIFAQRIKHGIDARFHHFFLAHRLIALVSEEVPAEQR